jgi:hypothetical protein
VRSGARSATKRIQIAQSGRRFLPDSLRYDRALLGDATLSVSVVLQASGERAAIVDAAATFTDDPSGARTWV